MPKTEISRLLWKNFAYRLWNRKEKTRRFSLRLKILAKEEQHPAFTSTYEDLLNQPTANTVQTRFQGREGAAPVSRG